MQKQKKISVVVPCYNVSAYLDRCMEHLLGQTIGIENIEIILVDDASTDNGATWDVIMKYEQQFSDVIIAIPLEQNLRQGGARNVGISYASGEYLVFCDADDWMTLEALEHLYQRAKEYDADVVEYRSQKVYAETDTSLFPMKEGDGSYLIELDDEEKKKEFYLTWTDSCTFGCWNKAYRLRMIQDNNIRFAEHLICEEPSFTVPVRLYEKRYCFLDELVYFYYLNPDSTVHSNWDSRKLDNLHVWMILMDDLKERGFLQVYYDEMSYMFFRWMLVLSVKMLIQKGYTLTVNEMQPLVNEVLTRFPDIRENPYIENRKDSLGLLLIKVLDMEITDESVQVMDQILRKYI